ncbi:MAG: molecular chaperone DnaJ, partial [Acidobacteria bacterium]|nr:molecular chaperone DnaJ [Acidobacteriota bacterium]
HPDRNPGDAESEERFKEAAEAYSVLGDDQKRSDYDRFGAAGLRSGQPFNADVFADFSDILGDLFGFGGAFGGMGRSQRARTGRGADLRVELHIDLGEAIAGVGKPITVRRHVACETCDASGSHSGGAPAVCERCRGTGAVQQRHGFLAIARTCGACGGSGRTVADPCLSCGGEGRVPANSKLTVRVPPGVDTGSRLLLRGEGSVGLRGAAAGDLEVLIGVREHPVFARRGKDLFTRVAVSFPQAALGGAVDVPTLDEEPTTLEIPAGVQAGEVFEIRGRGMPSVNGGRRGSLRVAVQVVTPSCLSSEQRALLEQLREVTEEPPLVGEAESWWDRLRNLVG